MLSVRVGPVANFAALGRQWRDLERRARPSFFQSWTWIGCLVDERFVDPLLVEASESGRTVALALFNVRRRWGARRLFLHESGSAEYDCPYIEQNGVLAEAGRETELAALALRAVTRRYRVVLSGIGQPQVGTLRSAFRVVVVERDGRSPLADLHGVRARDGDILAGCSANTRQQIRRSNRFYARNGQLAVIPAGSVATATAMLEEMAVLHQSSWQARGRPGSFARPFFKRFHQELIRTGHERKEVVLLRVCAGQSTIGILYNFVHGGRMLAYQSGLAYRADAPEAKPGLTCHFAAMTWALDHGLDVYDFLAGADRYKLSLSDSAYRLSWAQAGPVWSGRLWGGMMGSRVRALPGLAGRRRGNAG